MTMASTKLPITSSSAMAPSSIQGTETRIFERPPESMRAHIRDRIGTERLTPSLRLFTGQSGRGARLGDFRRGPHPHLFVDRRNRHRLEPN